MSLCATPERSCPTSSFYTRKLQRCSHTTCDMNGITLLTYCVCGKGSLLCISWNLAVPNSYRAITLGTLPWTSCHSVSVEPTLQPLAGGQFQHGTAESGSGAHAEQPAQGFWVDR